MKLPVPHAFHNNFVKGCIKLGLGQVVLVHAAAKVVRLNLHVFLLKYTN